MLAKITFAAAFTTLAMAAAAPAMAAPAVAVLTDEVATAAAAATAKTDRADNPSQRYCILWDIPNSHIKQKECRTLDRWQARGIDPRPMPRRR